jgi:type III secretory pathway component EscU
MLRSCRHSPAKRGRDRLLRLVQQGACDLAAGAGDLLVFADALLLAGPLLVATAMVDIGFGIPGRAALQLNLFNLSRMVLLVSAGAGAIASRIQTGPVFSAEPMKPQIQHLNPVSNAKRLLSMRTLVQFVLLAAKTLVIGVGVYLIYVNILGDAVRMVLGGVGTGLAVFEKAVLWLTVWGVVAFLAISAFDRF